MTTSLIYRSAAAYETAMMMLYGRHYPARLRTIADLIPDGAQVLKVCCGPGSLFRRHLRHKSVHYCELNITDLT